MLHRAGSDSILFSLTILLASTIPLLGILEHRMPRGHDTFQYFSLQYYFLNHAVEYGNVPQWMPFMSQGTVANWWYAIQGGMLQIALLAAAPWLSWWKGSDFLPIYYVGMFWDELVLLSGVWLLGRRYYDDPRTRCFVAISVWGSAIWFDQPWHNFHAYHALPLILELGHRFWDEGRWRYVFLAGNLLVLQIFGNMPYELPVTLLVIAAYFGAWLWRFPLAAWGSKTPSKKWLLRGAFTLVLVYAQFSIASQVLRHGTDEILNYNRARNADGTTSLVHFLTYSGNLNLNLWKEMLVGVSPGLDYTLFIGFAGLAGLILCCFRRPNPKAGPVIFTIGVLLLLSLGGALALVLYHTWPMMHFFRHLSLLSSVARLFVCLLAGFGFEAAILRPEMRRAPLDATALVLALLAAGCFYLSCHPPMAAAWLQQWTRPRLLVATSILQEDLLPSLLRLSGAFAGMTAATLFWIAHSQKHRTVLVAGLLALHGLGMAAYKHQMFAEKTMVLNGAQQNVNRFTPMPFPLRRNLFYGNNPRAQPFLENLLKRKTQIMAYGVLYWTTESYLFQDAPTSLYRIDHWLSPLDDFMRAFWRQPFSRRDLYPKGLAGILTFPTNAPCEAMAGISQDKISLFSGADFLSSDIAVASHLTASGEKGERLYLSGFPRGISSSPSERMNARWKITHFDANHLDLVVETPPTFPKTTLPWLYYADVWHPFWAARVNGQSVPVYKANLAYKAVPLQIGMNFVQFDFHSFEIRRGYWFLGWSAWFWIFAVLAILWRLSGGPTVLSFPSPSIPSDTPFASFGWEKWRCAIKRTSPIWMVGIGFAFFFAILVSPRLRDHALIYAAGQGYPRLTRWLLDCGANPRTADSQGMTPLLFAIMQGERSTARELLRRGADPHQLNSEGYGALYAAAMVGDEQMLDVLLETQPEIDFPNREGVSPLMICAWYGSEGMVRSLLKHGANPNHQNLDGQTALMFAAYQQHIAVVRELLATGATPRIADSSGTTALMIAARKGNEHLVKMLLRADANPLAFDNRRRTARQLALECGQTATAALLLRAERSQTR